MHYVLTARITFALVINSNSVVDLWVDMDLPQNYGSKYEAASLLPTRMGESRQLTEIGIFNNFYTYTSDCVFLFSIFSLLIKEKEKRSCFIFPESVSDTNKISISFQTSDRLSLLFSNEKRLTDLCMTGRWYSNCEGVSHRDRFL